jgi:hypothetical protein
MVVVQGPAPCRDATSGASLPVPGTRVDEPTIVMTRWPSIATEGDGYVASKRATVSV